VATRGCLRAGIVQFSPFELLLGPNNTLRSSWDAATHSCSTSVGWHCYPFQGILGGDAHTRARYILGAACSRPRCGQTACCSSDMWGRPSAWCQEVDLGRQAVMLLLTVSPSVRPSVHPSWLRTPDWDSLPYFCLLRKVCVFSGAPTLTGGRVCHVRGHSPCLCRV